MNGFADVCITLKQAFQALKEQAITTEAFCSQPDVQGRSFQEDTTEAEDTRGVGLGELDSACLELADVPRLDPQETVLRDKIGFFAGIVNLVFSTYWLGCSPQTWCNWYTVKAFVLFTVRIVLYRRRKWGFYLIEFCYYANLLLLVKIWILPNSELLDKVVFGLCAGPITFSIPALRNSLVLHSLDKMTSLFMHATPAVMAWCLRWHPFRQKDSLRGSWWFTLVGGVHEIDRLDAGFWDLFTPPLIAYLIWAVLYYIKVFVLSSDKIFNQNYSNMYTLMVTNSKSGAAKLVMKAPKKLQPATYLLLHCLLCSLTIALAAIFWHSKLLHTIVLVVCCAISAWNGTFYYFDIFAHKYVDKVGLVRKVEKSS